MRKKILYVFIMFLILIPSVVKADTWLDDPSYWDTSWFDPDTYDTTTEYTIPFSNDSDANAVAGLLHLVNDEGYTFENKIIEFDGGTFEAGAYILYLTDHQWVPLNSTFKGVFKFMSPTFFRIKSTFNRRWRLYNNTI